MKLENMKTLIRQTLREMELQNGDILDHKTQVALQRSCAGDSIKKIASFHLAINSLTEGNHLVNGAPLTICNL